MTPSIAIKKYFRGFVPVVIDLETSGSDHEIHGILEIAAVYPCWTDKWSTGKIFHEHVDMFPGAQESEDSMKIHGIIPDHPFRKALSETDMMQALAHSIQAQCQLFESSKAVLVAHNPHFDVSFLRAAEKRTGVTLPLHRYTMFDTATMGMMMYRETVLARVCMKAGLPFDVGQAHGALYDATMTADVFWLMVNAARKKLSSRSL